MSDTMTSLVGGGHLFVDARMLLVEAPVSGAAATALLPPPLEPATPATATFFFAHYPSTAFGSIYNEAGILLHAYDARGAVLHCPWIVVDDGTALVLGRELLGFPKKLAEIDFEVSTDKASAVARRGGVELMHIQADLGAADAEPAPVFDKRVVNAMGSLLTGMKLVEASTGEHVKTMRHADASLELGWSRRDPLADLAPGPATSARLVVLDYGAGGALPSIAGDVDPAWVARQFFPRAL